MVLNDLVDSFCYSQKNAGLKGLMLWWWHVYAGIIVILLLLAVIATSILAIIGLVESTRSMSSNKPHREHHLARVHC